MGSTARESRDKEVEQGMHVCSRTANSFPDRRAIQSTDCV